MISEYNRQHNRIYPLNEKGYRQAQRNNSHQIWTLLSWEEQTICSQPNKQANDQTFHSNVNEESKIAPNEDKVREEEKDGDLNISKNDENTGKLQHKNNQEKRENVFIRSKPEAKEPPLQTELQKLKRKSIEKYLKDLTPYTRTLSNSAFRKLYQRPCPETYGRMNTHTERGAFYGNFMKTHNIQPHTLDNKPETYQTYASALNYGKRTKLDLEERWKRIERQLAKNLDYRELAYMKAVGQIDIDVQNKKQVLKASIDVYGSKEGQKFTLIQPPLLTKSTKSLGKMETRATFKNTYKEEELKNFSEEKRRAKSSDKPLYFIYKYQQQEEGYNCTRYARDRHGITCYVDNCFRQNDEAYTQFLRNVKQIYPQKCKTEDINIDQVRIDNCLKSKQQQESIPRHYLMPNVQIPYSAQNYSRKKKKSPAQAVQQ